MMKRMFCLLLTVLMGVSCIFASAEDAQDNSADALTLAELQAFAARMQTLAMASTPLNDPADAKTEDGYQAALLSQQHREIKIKRYARVIEGHILDFKPDKRRRHS